MGPGAWGALGQPSSGIGPPGRLRDALTHRCEHARRLEINDLDHIVFMNEGNHFTPSSLPTIAQLAPAFYAGVADFNGDGKEDLFLSALEDEWRYGPVQQFCRQIVECQRLWRLLKEGYS